MNIEDVLKEMRDTAKEIADAEGLYAINCHMCARWVDAIEQSLSYKDAEFFHATRRLDRATRELERLNSRLSTLEEDRLERDAKIDLLTRKVEHLSKNKCIGCIDSICDDCATEEEYLSFLAGHN